MNTANNLGNRPPFLFGHQKDAFDKLLRAANVCFSPLRQSLEIQPRTNSLLIGPSGVGKSHLAHSVAAALGMECKSLTVAEWMVLGSGSKGAQRTWNAIFEFLLRNKSKPGSIIFVDEVDKLTGDTDWSQHLRVEFFRLVDLKIPSDLIDTEDQNYAPSTVAQVEKFLRYRTFIIAAGAFQEVWDSRSKKIGGFGAECPPEPATQDHLSKYLARELVNRFRSDIVILPELKSEDYEQMLLVAVEKIPARFQTRFLKLGESRIRGAQKNKQGVRFLEELVADILADSTESLDGLAREGFTRWKSTPAETRNVSFLHG